MKPATLKISVQDHTTRALKKIVGHACLDSPRDEQQSEGTIVLYGWLLPVAASHQLRLIIRKGANRRVQELDVQRPDVLRRVLKVDESALTDHARLTCGFRIVLELQIHQSLEISIDVGEQEYLWKTIQNQPAKFDTPHAIDCWSAYCRSKTDCIDTYALNEHIRGLSDERLEALFFDDVKEYATRHIVYGTALPDMEGCQRFLQHVMRDAFPVEAVSAALEHGAITVPDPLSDQSARADESYALAEQVNVIKFTAFSGEVFFVFQHVSSVDAFYFPTRRVILNNGHFSAERVKSFMRRFIRQLPRVVRYSAGRRRFLGIIASHSRPSHFYYDIAVSISDLEQAGSLKQVPRIVYYPGGNFCSFKSLYSLRATEFSLTPDEIWASCVADQGFYFHVGTIFSYRQNRCTSRFDSQLVAHARDRFIQKSPDVPARLLARYPLVWFGVTTDKRAWLQQVEGAVNLLTALRKDYPNVGVIFDGWTSPLDPIGRDLRETARDNAVITEITRSLDPSIAVFSVVGAGSAQKIVYAKCADVYVGNAATGGLHVARFAGCPGVAHLNTQMIDSGFHVRKRTRLVDKALILDEADSAGRRMDFISYSLDWRVIYDEVMAILQGASV